MGNYLTSPNSVKHSQNGSLGRFQYGACAMQGWRVSMEDSHVIHYFERLEPANTSAALFGVYDGHGGPQVAQYVSRHLVEELLKNPDFRKGRFDAAFRSTYIALDALLSNEESQHELEWFSRTQSSREALESGSNLSAPFPPPRQTTSFEGATPKSVPPSTTPTAAANDQPQKAGFRSSVKLGGKMFHRRGDKRRKTDGEPPGSPLHEGKDCCKESSSSSSDELMESSSSPSVLTKLDGENKTTDEMNASVTTLEKASVAAVDNMISDGQSNANSIRSPNDISGGDANMVDGQQSGGHGKQGQMAGVGGSPNLFSLSGLRSLFSGMMKLGTSGRSSQLNQGLAMLTGCTAVSVLVTDKQVVVANAGDSRCVLCRGNVAVELSKDHKPQLPEERSRIYSAGGWLEMGRVNGNLNLSRALGDLIYKVNASLPPDRQIVSPVPDVIFADLTEQDEFLILGCDGIWESSTSQEIVDFIRERIDDVLHLSDVLEVLFEELLSPNPTLFEFGCDNMTAIIVDLHPDRRHPPQRSPRISSSSFDGGRAVTVPANQPQPSPATVTPQLSTSAQRSRTRDLNRVPNRHRGSAPAGSFSTSKEEPLLVDRESFWEGHDGSPFASDRSSSTQRTATTKDYPTWEGVVAAISQGGPANPLVESIAHPPKESKSDKLKPGQEPPSSSPSLMSLPPHKPKTSLSVSSNDIPSPPSSPSLSSPIAAPNPLKEEAPLTSSVSDPLPNATQTPSTESSTHPFPPHFLSNSPSTVSTPSSTPIPQKSHTNSISESPPSKSSTRLITTACSDVPQPVSQQQPPIQYLSAKSEPIKAEIKSHDPATSLVQSTHGSDSRPVSIRRQSSNAEASPKQSFNNRQ